MMRSGASLVLLVGLAGCATTTLAPSGQSAHTNPVAQLAALPQPVSNNAVAGILSTDGARLFSFLGLGPGKTWRDARSDAWVLEVNFSAAGGTEVQNRWRRIPDVPGPGGRLAATAAAVGGAIYVLGGYTVAEDGSEKSVALVHRLDPDTWKYTPLAPMPVPVDDTVSLVYMDRYLYLVSGWHDDDNVNLVQVYDTHTDHWFRATEFPGPPVFGHAGGMVGNQMVICDGVKVVPGADGKRDFLPSRACFVGAISPARPESIVWRPIEHYPGPARYRMAAASDDAGRVFFAAGSDNPYNFNGIGYDGEPAQPSASVFAFSLQTETWAREQDLPAGSMDHRGLIRLGDRFVIVGGMGSTQRVLSRVVEFSPE